MRIEKNGRKKREEIRVESISDYNKSKRGMEKIVKKYEKSSMLFEIFEVAGWNLSGIMEWIFNNWSF